MIFISKLWPMLLVFEDNTELILKGVEKGILGNLSKVNDDHFRLNGNGKTDTLISLYSIEDKFYGVCATVFPEPIGMAASFDDALLYKIYDAVSDVLFGDYNSAGKLSVTFYKSSDQLKDFEFYDWSQREMTVTPGEYEILYGSSSDNNNLKTLKVSIR